MMPGVNIPADLKYTEDHEWARISDTTVRVGITDYAQSALGDVVFVQLPAVGSQFEAKAVLGEVESTKSVSEIYSPVGGKVTAVNELLNEKPELVNSDPYGDGWICELEVEGEIDGYPLITAQQYGELATD